MLAETSYCIKPLEEIIVVIDGCGFRYNDDTIYLMQLTKDKNGDQQFGPALDSCHQLCFFIKNCSPEFTICIGVKTPLNWLLESPRIMSKLCYCTFGDLATMKLNWRKNNSNQEINNVAVADETIVIY